MKQALVLTLATWLLAATTAFAQPKLDPLDANYVATLKSSGADYGVAVEFRNVAPFTVEILWIDYSGNVVSFGNLPPGETMRQATYVGHPWLVRETTNKKMLVGFIPRAACTFQGCLADIDGALVPVEPATWSLIKARHR